MCGRFDTSRLTWAEIHGQLSKFAPVRTAGDNMVAQNDDVRPTTQQLVARLVDGAFEIEPMRWGLVPGWWNGKRLKDSAPGAKDGFKLTTFNCVGETAAEKPTFKTAYKKWRCLVPANAWYEWTGEPGSKIKHTFARADGGVIWFGGLWERVTTADAGEVASFTILTHAADGWLTDYHHRAPLILEEADWGDWLTGSTALPHPRADRFHLAAA